MRPKIREKEEAIRMRLKGHTLPEICKKLGVSKGGCQVWLKGLHLPPEIRAKIERKKTRAQDKGRTMMKRRREERNRILMEQAEDVFRSIKINKNLGKILCATLYWAEGEKRTSAVAFSNSDPNMVRTYISLLRRYFDVNDNKFRALLHVHEYHDIKKQKKFWSKVTGIPLNKINIYKKPNSGKNIRSGYPGCISVRYYDVRLAREIEYLYTAFIKTIGV